MKQPTATPAFGPFRVRSRSLAFGLLLLLTLQFLLGMITNLFVTIPATHPGTGATNFFVGLGQGVGWALAAGAGVLQLHAVVGLGLILLGIALMTVAYTTRERVWMICAPIVGLAMLGASFSGASFLIDGQTVSSLLMSVWFFIALISLATGLYLTPQFNQ